MFRVSSLFHVEQSKKGGYMYKGYRIYSDFMGLVAVNKDTGHILRARTLSYLQYQINAYNLKK